MSLGWNLLSPVFCASRLRHTRSAFSSALKYSFVFPDWMVEEPGERERIRLK